MDRARTEMPVGPLFCIIDGPSRGGPWSSDAQRAQLCRLAAEASVRRRFVYSLTQRLSRAGISRIMISELPDLFHIGHLAEYGISHLSDNVILLQYLRANSRLLRTVTVLKSRTSAHDPEIRKFEITADGIVLGDPIAGDHV